MSGLRAPVITALALLIVSGDYCGQSGSASARATTSLLQLLAASGRDELEHHAQSTEHQAHSSLPIKTEYAIESRKGNEVNKSNQHDQTLDVIPRDLRQKEKFLKHLTGPLYFSPKCSKRFYRLYHNTRDCTIPAYYRRCAQLLRSVSKPRKTVNFRLKKKKKMNNPIPSNLKSEAKKAAKILREFTEISNRQGPDKLIPAHVIAKAHGLAILSVFKAGFMITARGGSGIVIARLADGRWSAPSAIGIAGLGGGFEIGLEASDFVIILNQRRAVEAFSKGGNLTFGGNCTVAVGPLGRNMEADVAFRSTAAVYSYCRSRGLYAGVSLVGSYIMERKETNRKFYGQDIRASGIINGDVEPPPEAYDLYTILDDYTDKYTSDWQSKYMNPNRKSIAPTRPAPPTQRTASSFSSRAEASSASFHPRPTLYPSLPSWGSESSGEASGGTILVTAMHAFTGQQPGDLSFAVGDRITVITKTDSQYDWWEGELRGQVGIFPANFVSLN
ncbi:hypothetical protein Q7C36_011502 [Tachysurus vachellii]|uniref:SH3 domain-containing YSC84-like protein 1 n=2 Tax=Tachysurus vachellii TaxID=175792 RepID=A0AA88SP36_TACVA|nr:hypothetical protein Q7C36_011502 [Tachysurus vachellii]